MWNTDAQPPTARQISAVSDPANRTLRNFPVSSPIARNTKMPEVMPSSTLNTSKGHCTAMPTHRPSK